MKTCMVGSSALSLLYMNSSHPVILMTFILAQTLIICVSAWLKLKVSWFSYILFLIFLGGLMVLFIYITSLASNEMISLKLSKQSVVISTLSLTAVMGLINLNLQQPMSLPSAMTKTFSFMYSWSALILISATMVYLLLTLIIVIKVSNKFEAPIKNLIFK